MTGCGVWLPEEYGRVIVLNEHDGSSKKNLEITLLMGPFRPEWILSRLSMPLASHGKVAQTGCCPLDACLLQVDSLHADPRSGWTPGGVWRKSSTKPQSLGAPMD